jgi:hypothetical protein
MKWMILLFLAALGAFIYYQKQHPYDASKSTPVQYTKSLQNDVKKAEDTAAKAQATINQMSQQVQKAGKDESPNPEAGQ